MADQQNRFPLFADIFLHAHFDGENAKFVQIKTQLQHMCRFRVTFTSTRFSKFLLRENDISVSLL